MTKHAAKSILRELSWVGYTIWRRVRQRAFALKRAFVRPSLPVSPDGKVRVHLGCGDIASPEFINVDARPAPHVHHVCDVTDLSVFADGSVDLVYACHVLEHVRHRALKRTLWEWQRVLKVGGVLRISVPDFDRIIGVYESCGHDLESILSPLMGGQDHKHNIHYSLFNRAYLLEKLREAGFRDVRSWDAVRVENHDFVDWASRRIEREGRRFEISLNLEAVKGV